MIQQQAHVTPVFSSVTLNELGGNEVYCKGEHLQKVGAFKFRGAYHAVSQLTPSQLEKGLITVSSGNHAQALALAGKLHHAKVHIVMPDTASNVKRKAVLSYGAMIHDCGNLQSEREEALSEIQKETGSVCVHPYDHPDVIAGQGTVCLEFLDQVSKLDVLVAPVGGGGLLSGLAVAGKSLSPSLKIYGAEPLGADDAARSFASGKRLPQLDPRTMADGLQTGLGELNWEIIKNKVDGIWTVSEREIFDTTLFVWERMKQVVEPSAAVALAAVMSEPFRNRYQGKRVGVVFSGGNVSPDFFQLHKQS